MGPKVSLPHLQESTTCSSSIQSMPLSHILIHFNIIFHLRLDLASRLFPQVPPPTTQSLYAPPVRDTCYMPSSSFYSWFGHTKNWWEVQTWLSSLFHSPVTSSLFCPVRIFLNTLSYDTLSLCERTSLCKCVNLIQKYQYLLQIFRTPSVFLLSNDKSRTIQTAGV